MNNVLKTSLRPVRNLALTLVLNLTACAVLFEAVEPGDHGPIGFAYWTVTTGTTTGYGDVSPQTLLGRLIAMWLMISSVVFVAIATGQIAGAVANNPHLFSKESQEEVHDDLDDIIGMLCTISEHLGLEVPESVEEYHNKKEGHANG